MKSGYYRADDGSIVEVEDIRYNERLQAIRLWLREWLSSRLKPKVGADFQARRAVRHHVNGVYEFEGDLFDDGKPRRVDFFDWL